MRMPIKLDLGGGLGGAVQAVLQVIFIAAPVDEVVPELYKAPGGGGKLIL